MMELKTDLGESENSSACGDDRQLRSNQCTPKEKVLCIRVDEISATFRKVETPYRVNQTPATRRSTSRLSG